MQRITVNTLSELNSVLLEYRGWANGKNFSIDSLQATAAQSRWGYENIHGIYLTNESHIWMALWMALVDRKALQKRYIRYVRSHQRDDLIGRIELFSTKNVTDLLCDTPHLYIFKPHSLSDEEIVDLTSVPKPDKLEALLRQDFEEQRTPEDTTKLIDTADRTRLVLVDEWQLAITNTPKVFPDVEIAIQQNAIAELAQRITLTDIEVGEDYISKGN